MIKYKEYLTDAEPEKKKEQSAVGATTPTTPPVLPYEGFIGTGTGSNAYRQGAGVVNSAYNTAINAAETNKQLGMNYAQGVKNSIYGSAAALRKQTDIDTENARQRGIVDSQSSYQKAVGAYGSNAETLAGRGLSGSGYGEYLTADAYATHRGQVQDINAGALEANRKAANLEAQTKMAADSEYLKNLYDIESEYNTAKSTAEGEKTKGLYELGVGLDAAKDTAYNDILTAISEGTSLDVAKQSGAWGDLTPEQQNMISKSYYSGGVSALMSAEDSAGRAYSKSEAESALRGAGYSEADIPIIIASWQEDNYKQLANDATLTETDIANNEEAGKISAEQAEQLRAKIPKTPNTGNNTTIVKTPTDISEFGTAITENARWDGSRWVYPGASALSNQVYADTDTRDKLNQAYPNAQNGFMVRVPGTERDMVYIRSGTGWIVDAAKRPQSNSEPSSSSNPLNPPSDPFKVKK